MVISGEEERGDEAEGETGGEAKTGGCSVFRSVGEGGEMMVAGGCSKLG